MNSFSLYVFVTIVAIIDIVLIVDAIFAYRGIKTFSMLMLETPWWAVFACIGMQLLPIMLIIHLYLR